MRKAAFIILFVLAGFSVGHAQQAKPMPTPPEDGDVVKIRTNLIQVDVSVTDRKGNAVRDLKPEDFEIFENGEKQSISNFKFISTARRAEEPAKQPNDGVAIPPPPATLRPEQIRRTFALVVDDLSLSFESAYQTRRALKKFVDEQVQDGDLVAIIRTGAGIGALQQFTSDKRQLYAAVERVKWNPLGSGGIGAFAPIEPTPLEIAKATGDTTVSDEDIEQERNSIKSVDDFRNSIFATGTLGALRFVVKGMSELPGRKSVILFSDGFRLLERDSQGFSDGGRVLEFLRQLVDLANRASVVFYTIDARGLQTTGYTAQDKVISPSPQAFQQTLSDRRDQLLDTQDGLQYLATETGGFAVVNNNDLSGGVRKILDDQSYYLIGYEPDSDTFDAGKRKFNKLEVKVKRPEISVRYRSGFFNVAEEKMAKPSAGEAPKQRLEDALASPFAVNDIALKLNLLFGDDVKIGSYVRALLHVEAKDLKFVPEANGMKKASFEVATASFGDNGVPVDKVTRGYTISVNEERFKKIQAEGFVYYLQFPTKTPGGYQYRVAVRDVNADTVGSASQFVEIPDLKKGKTVVSSIVLDSFSSAQWEKIVSDKNPPAELPTNSLGDTSLRRFKADTVVRYGFEVYNAKLDAARKPNLTTKIRVFKEGKLLLDGQSLPLELLGQTDMEHLKSVGVVSFGKGTPAGDYVLQIIVTDNLAIQKVRTATQFVQFEIVD